MPDLPKNSIFDTTRGGNQQLCSLHHFVDDQFNDLTFSVKCLEFYLLGIGIFWVGFNPF